MSDPSEDRWYMDIGELSARSGISKATINRLKKAGKIPFFQPGGKGGRVVFPRDALQRTGADEARPQLPASDSTRDKQRRLSGRLPDWMRDFPNTGL